MTAAEKRASFTVVWHASHKWNFVADKFQRNIASARYRGIGGEPALK